MPVSNKSASMSGSIPKSSGQFLIGRLNPIDDPLEHSVAASRNTDRLAPATGRDTTVAWEPMRGPPFRVAYSCISLWVAISMVVFSAVANRRARRHLMLTCPNIRIRWIRQMQYRR